MYYYLFQLELRLHDLYHLSKPSSPDPLILDLDPPAAPPNPEDLAPPAQTPPSSTSLPARIGRVIHSLTKHFQGEPKYQPIFDAGCTLDMFYTRREVEEWLTEGKKGVKQACKIMINNVQARIRR